MSNSQRHARILIVDDDVDMRQMLVEALEDEGHSMAEAGSGEQALEFLKAHDIDLVITDLRMGGLDGMELVKRSRELAPNAPIIMMTAFGSIETAIEAIKAGAFNFITKPFKMASLLVLVDRALDERWLRTENTRLIREVQERFSYRNIIGASRAMQEVYDLIERVADTPSNVLVLGDSGTGKELVARALHYSGTRATKPFIPVNATSLPESLLESELFGHARGAFTGAVTAKRGLVDAAEGGTLFLDEIGDLDIHLQAKLLRVLEDHEVRPVGAVASHRVDVRVIAGTHRNLQLLVQKGDFREDLFYRLNVITIRMPPLRERRDDIPRLAQHFIERHAERLNRKAPKLNPEALDWLVEQRWPGNVRELENMLERAIVLARGDELQLEDVKPKEGSILLANASDIVLRGRPTLDELEQRYIDQVLEECDGDKQRASTVLGVSTRTLYRKEKR